MLFGNFDDYPVGGLFVIISLRVCLCSLISRLLLIHRLPITRVFIGTNIARWHLNRTISCTVKR